MKDMSFEIKDIDPFDVEDEEDLNRLDRGMSGMIAQWARAFCIIVGMAVWPFLVWYVLL